MKFQVSTFIVIFLPLLLSGCFGSSPCQVKLDDMGSYIVVEITNTTDKNLLLDAQGGKPALTVEKKLDGDWIYDLDNMTRKSGTVKLNPKETTTIRKYISKRDKKIKYRFEFKCDGDKVKTDEF
ncbi:MAG: hypothetical protein EP326_16150 [Deltaproteobacteria bacterium]|nr:MAG: hypothetical protein EP326_16150 [Deltaproteobacteria bacterium]TNF27879.1 MAG: hypothetical protein EP319_10325 [Deltaproteobacteria bacterium]